MRFTVEVEEFYLEEEDLSSVLQHQLKQAIVSEIRKNIADQVAVFMDKHIKGEIQSDIQTRVQLLMEDYVAKGKLKGGYSSDPEMTIPEYIAKQFSNSRGDLTKIIENKVKAHVSELQQRYDLMFATQLITKIKEQGFLKDEAVKMLLGETSPKS